jgi:uncharacterized protein involved in exopolysaccharide biosynthesis
MNNLNKNRHTSENEIDLLELAKKLWEERKFILKVCGIGVVLGLIIAFSLPKEYKTEVIFASDVSSNNLGGFGSLASMIGINLQQNSTLDLSPEIYPDIVISTPFLVGLFDIHIKDPEENIDTSFYEYMFNHQKKAWWGYILEFPGLIKDFFSSKENKTTSTTGQKSRIIRISDEQEDVLLNLEDRIKVYIDTKTGEISLTVKMQSADISAFIADTISSYMQEYIIDYRTQKTRQDLAYTETLFNETQAKYHEMQQKYATYMDENLAIVSARYRTTQERLRNEMEVAYTIYNQMSQQLQLAKIKVQDTTPVYSIIQPPVVPLKRTSPKRTLILAGFIFLSFAGAIAWIYVKEPKLTMQKRV